MSQLTAVKTCTLAYQPQVMPPIDASPYWYESGMAMGHGGGVGGSGGGHFA